MTTLALVTGGAFCVWLGFVSRGHIERRRAETEERERVLVALGGELPDWERHAQAIEDEADLYEMNGLTMSASDKRKDARRVRRVALRRLRRGRPALP